MRHHCYELHIGLTAMAWNVWVGDSEALQQVATQLAVVLERGPLPVDTQPLIRMVSQQVAQHERTTPIDGSGVSQLRD